MRVYNVKAYAKLNLSLDVGERRDDGYHEMTMIMQTATLCDDVRIERAGEGFTCLTNLRYIPCDERNLAAKAAREFFAAAGLSGGAKLTVTKRIPVGSGMGGGSADAAAVLRGLNAMNGRPFRKAELEEIGARVGSDVPFCIAGGTQLARGRGEILSPLTPPAQLPFRHLQAQFFHLHTGAFPPFGHRSHQMPPRYPGHGPGAGGGRSQGRGEANVQRL
jgi:4-diphosphocytidyl-2-C-methyl-D-erythritol kinase